MSAATESTTPRVWVACLACYNDGRLRGAWVDAIDPDDLWAGIAEVMNHGDKYGRHEEHAFHDHEGFGSFRVAEYATVESVCAVGAGIEAHGEPFSIWLDNDETNLERYREDPDAFEGDYLGEWDSVEAWADEQWESCGHERALDQWKGETFGPDSGMARNVNFDAAAYAHDCICGGDIWTAEGSDYKTHVFR